MGAEFEFACFRDCGSYHRDVKTIRMHPGGMPAERLTTFVAGSYAAIPPGWDVLGLALRWWIRPRAAPPPANGWQASGLADGYIPTQTDV